MATAEMPSGPRSARLADDAATAALYAVHPRRKASVRDKPAPDSLNSNQRVVIPNLSHASAASALAHANHKPVEVWRPGRYTEAEKAALCVKDFSPPEVPQPSAGYSAEGLGAAILAVREQRSTQAAREKEIEMEQTRAQEKERQAKALKAATGAYATRKRADSVPSEPVIKSEPRYTLTATGPSRHLATEEDRPLDHLDNAMEASRITHAANQNAKLYTSAPPVASEVQERNRRNSLHAAALVMAKDMYDVGDSKEVTTVDPALYAAQRGHGQAMARSRNTVSGAVGTTGRNALTLQEAAQKRAAEKLARLRNEHAEMQAYYGTTPQPQRSRLTTRRKRASSDADATQTDAEQSKYIRHQMTSLRTKLNRVDEKRQQDRDLLMEAARRNVDQTMQNMDMKMWADSGRAPPSMQKEWDEAAKARIRRETESAEASSANVNADRVNIGGHQYMEMADVEAVARSRLQPTLDEISDQAEKQRAQELEERLDVEEQERQAAIEKEREADMITATKQNKGTSKRQSKGINFFQLLRRKSRRVPDEKPVAEEEAADVATDKATESPTGEDSRVAEGSAAATGAGAAAVTGAATTAETVPAVEITPTSDASNVPEVAPTTESSARAEEDASTREIRNVSPPGQTVPAVETVASVPEDAAAEDASATEAKSPQGLSTPSGVAAAQEPFEGPETPGAATVFAAGPNSAPLKVVDDPVSLDENTGTPRYFPDQQDAAAVGGVSPMPTVHPITSPRADSKLRTWFRDRLVRRSSGPIPVYPHQPGPDFNTDSEVGFSGGAALREQNGSRGAALSSHPVTGDDLDRRSTNGNGAEVSKMSTYDSTSSGQVESSSKRQRLRKSFMKTIGRSNQDSKTNGIDRNSHSRTASGVIPDPKESDSGIRSLRNSAVEQGLPVPPAIGDNASTTGRESRFSEDL